MREVKNTYIHALKNIYSKTKYIQIALMIVAYYLLFIWLLHHPDHYTYSPEGIIQFDGRTMYQEEICPPGSPGDIFKNHVGCSYLIRPVPPAYTYHQTLLKIRPWILGFCFIYLSVWAYLHRKDLREIMGN